jgi:thymidylate synthase ThyX
MPKEISARIIADSINEHGNRLTTFIVCFPRFLLAELNTHRMFSRNSASSRARPFTTMLKEIRENPFIPIKWLAQHKGMQGYEEVQDKEKALEAWLKAKDNAIQSALLVDETKISKQFVNRILEPFMWHEVIITATEYENFFSLRAAHDAEIHIAHLANLMLEEYNKSSPKMLAPGEWHIPFGDQMDDSRIAELTTAVKDTDQIKKEIACARCARLSYKNFGSEEGYNYEADCKLFASLVDGNHMSPLEHCARSMTSDEYNSTNGWSGNFYGFIQFRKMFVSENRKDPRVVCKKRVSKRTFEEEFQLDPKTIKIQILENNVNKNKTYNFL